MPCTPRTCPSMRRRRVSSSSFVAVYPRGVVVVAMPPLYHRGVSGSGAILDALDALGARAVRTAIGRSVRLDTVADDLAAAVRALGRQGVDRALERVERVRVAT